MKKKTKLKLSDVFHGLQKQMESKLTFNRKTLLHSVEKGDSSELEWGVMLSTYLPARYSVGRAHIIDYEGNFSEQIDIVIYDRQYSPFILKQNGATYIPAECVYAVIEIKQEITLNNLRYAVQKASSVRKLKRTSAKIIQADGKDFQAKKPPKILAGILAINGKMTQNMKIYLKGLDETNCLNFGCSLNSQYFKINNFQQQAENSLPLNIDFILNSENGLVLFFLNLLSELQKMGTVPAIEIDKYISNI